MIFDTLGLLSLFCIIYFPLFRPRTPGTTGFLFSDGSVCRAIESYEQEVQLSGTLKSRYRTRSGWLWDYLKKRRRGVAYLTLMWTYRIAGFRRINVYHAIDVTIHFINVLLVYSIVGEFSTDTVARLTALAWALHPLVTYTPCFVSARFGLLCTFFMLASVTLLLSGFWMVAALSGVLAFNCKEESVVLPLWWGFALWFQ